MRTLGIDLAAQAKRTAMCAIRWEGDRATVEPPAVGVDDEELLAAMREADRIGIDAPFGWPDAMIQAVTDHAEGRPWPETASSANLRYRATDWFVQAATRGVGRATWPLSVSSDRIAVCAWRCARLLTRLSADLGGNRAAARERAVEVYPAAALAMWGLPSGGYKAASGPAAAAATDVRRTIVDGLVDAAGPWLTVPSGTRDACVAGDDALDAMISGLVARAAATGLSLAPPAADADVVRREGWIHLPRPDSLALLAAG